MSNEELDKAAREYFESLEDDEDVRTYFKAGAKWAMDLREKEVEELTNRVSELSETIKLLLLST